MLNKQNILKFIGNSFIEQEDNITVEEPLELRLGFGKETQREQKSISVTMRTPRHDAELAIGFLITEGIINSSDDLLSVKHCGEIKSEEKNNVIRAEVKPEIKINWKKLERNFYTTSSCGVCGKSSIEAVKNNCTIPISVNDKISATLILSLANRLIDSQLVFNLTGGIHASALFDFFGNLVMVREDVGRHNALDKIIGACAVKNNLPLSKNILLLSGRISFELIQKAAVAGIPVVVGIGAPSTLAVQLANEMNITLVGFLKPQKFNIYTSHNRIYNG